MTSMINGASHGMPLTTLDALGKHHPINPDAPNPRNAATVAHLTQIMAAMRTLHKSMQAQPAPVLLSPVEARARIIQQFKEAS